MATRTLSEKVADIKTTYTQFQELLTDEALRALVDSANDAAAKAIEAGDIRAYADMVQARLGAQRVVSANDRAALMAATLAAGSGGTRVLPAAEEE